MEEVAAIMDRQVINDRIVSNGKTRQEIERLLYSVLLWHTLNTFAMRLFQQE